jgi:2-polyprenyl-3-methyl-5-hydroxy-6-metoxy-1,4-benzoquinol methylase
MSVLRTVGSEFQEQLDAFSSKGAMTLGPSASHLWRTDPRRMPIVLSRYKFVAKMLAGKKRAIEVGCGDGFQMRVVLQEVDFVHGVDYDPSFIDWATKHAAQEKLNAAYSVCDVIVNVPPGRYEAAYSLDVIEHIPIEREAAFLRNIAATLPEHGICIVGTPNITADPYASLWSKMGHINLKSAEALRAAMVEQFYNVLMFSMNDEVVHTGFSPMAHYLLAIGIGVRSSPMPVK